MPPKTKRGQQEVEEVVEESSSDESDPDDDVAEEDLARIVELEEAAAIEVVRSASRLRVADRTRSQYDLFVGLMANFATQNLQWQSLVLHKEGRLTFHLPLPITFVQAYFDYVEAKRVPWPDKPESTKPVSASYFRTCVLCIKDLYLCEQTVLDGQMLLYLNSRRSKFLRFISDLKANNQYPETKNRYLTSEGYAQLATAVLKSSAKDFSGWATQAFASLWGYVVLLWCLMARCDRVARLMWQDVGWYKDAMTIHITKSKSDQLGLAAFAKKLYFNRKKPEVCPITACAVLFFSRDESIRSDFVFPRADTRRAGQRNLHRIIQANFSVANMPTFGCDPAFISWHYFKRGAFTFLSGLTDAASFVATKLRADHKVADVSRVYTFFGQGQDGVVGRLLSLLPYGEPDFVECAPFMDPPLSIEELKDFIHDYDELPQFFSKCVVPRFVAVIAYRYDWLLTNLPVDHPIRLNRIMMNGKLVPLLHLAKLEHRSLHDLTGVSLEVKNSIRLHEIASTSRGVPFRPELASMGCDREKRYVKDDLGMRLVAPISSQWTIPHMSTLQAWNAWWSCDYQPIPLRFLEGRLPPGSKQCSQRTALSKIKSVVQAVQANQPASECIKHTQRCFDCGFSALVTSLSPRFQLHKGQTPSTINSYMRNAATDGWTPPKALQFELLQSIPLSSTVTASSFIPGCTGRLMVQLSSHSEDGVLATDAAPLMIEQPQSSGDIPPLLDHQPPSSADTQPPLPTSRKVRCNICNLISSDKSGFNKHHNRKHSGFVASYTLACDMRE
jgi:hypothetical protein